jgi:hypothetical protein
MNILLIVVIAIVLYSLYKSCFCKDTEGFRDNKETNVLKEIDNKNNKFIKNTKIYNKDDIKTLSNIYAPTCQSKCYTSSEFENISNTTCLIPKSKFMDISAYYDDYEIKYVCTNLYDCEPGTYCPGSLTGNSPYGFLPGSYPCDRGYSCPNTGQITDQISANICPPGTYTPIDSSNASCTDCPEGTYQDLSGQNSCKPCPDGFYCPPGSNLPIVCNDPISNYSNTWHTCNGYNFTPCPNIGCTNFDHNNNVCLQAICPNPCSATQLIQCDVPYNENQCKIATCINITHPIIK